MLCEVSLQHFEWSLSVAQERFSGCFGGSQPVTIAPWHTAAGWAWNGQSVTSRIQAACYHVTKYLKWTFIVFREKKTESLSQRYFSSFRNYVGRFFWLEITRNSRQSSLCSTWARTGSGSFPAPARRHLPKAVGPWGCSKGWTIKQLPCLQVCIFRRSKSCE